jgi:hypothetical protein
MPFLDLKRNVAGVLLPYNRAWKRDDKGRRYNDAHRVFYEAKAIINEILDAGVQPQADAPAETLLSDHVAGPNQPRSAKSRHGFSCTGGVRG